MYDFSILIITILPKLMKGEITFQKLNIDYLKNITNMFMLEDTSL